MHTQKYLLSLKHIQRYLKTKSKITRKYLDKLYDEEIKGL